MNYRHAFHAGNAADCMKHALLLALLDALRHKPAGFTVLDTHAGIGLYDLSSPEAVATGEWRAGIGRLRAAPHPALDAYLARIPDPACYPGSPALVRAMLRPQDRLIACELHPQDAALLRRRFARDPQVAVHARDGFDAPGALWPPATGRGLVLIDPPYERADDADRLVAALRCARARFRPGILAAWYPVKHMAPVRALLAQVATLPDAIDCRLCWRPADDPARLNGSGLVVVNPPFGFQDRAAILLDALLAGLGGPGGTAAVERLSDE